MKSQVVLIIIYNHRYDQNINVLERIYKDRFSNIYHLIPFYEGNKSNVIPVYENSYYFQGYMAQGFKSFYDESFAHYFFVADDLMLHPQVNENNYREFLSLDGKSSYIPEIESLHQSTNYWMWTIEALHFRLVSNGVEISKELPGYEEAEKRFAGYGLEIKPVKLQQVFTPQRLEQIKQANPDTSPADEYALDYPLVKAYSDIVVISANIIKQFCQYCGVFAAAKLFVEIAIPTALVLTQGKIVTESGQKLQGKPLWTREDYQILQPYQGKLKSLMDHFPDSFLFLHPVKLSKWDLTGI